MDRDCLMDRGSAAYHTRTHRYCAMYTLGGIYWDAEDVLLEPLSRLVRPCDSLVLVRDFCPVGVTVGMSDAESQDLFGERKGTSEHWHQRMRAKPLDPTPPCPYAAVQISFSARAQPSTACWVIPLYTVPWRCCARGATLIAELRLGRLLLMSCALYRRHAAPRPQHSEK